MRGDVCLVDEYIHESILTWVLSPLLDLGVGLDFSLDLPLDEDLVGKFWRDGDLELFLDLSSE